MLSTPTFFNYRVLIFYLYIIPVYSMLSILIMTTLVLSGVLSLTLELLQRGNRVLIDTVNLIVYILSGDLIKHISNTLISTSNTFICN